eukprot:534775_1
MSSYGLYGTVESKSNRTDSNLLVRDDDRFRTGTPFQDKLFAIVFLIWFILITILSIFFFVQNEDTFESHSQNRDNAYLNQYFWNLLLASIVISAVTSIVLLCIYHKYSQHLIWITFVSSCLLWLIYGMTLIISIGSIVLGLFVLFIALLELLWIYLNRDRIQFTTALLQLSIQGLNSCMSTYFISILGILFQIAWIIIWCMGFAYSIDGTQATKSTIVLYILAYYWIFQVISNIVMCTICGGVAVLSKHYRLKSSATLLIVSSFVSVINAQNSSSYFECIDASCAGTSFYTNEDSILRIFASGASSLQDVKVYAVNTNYSIVVTE